MRTIALDCVSVPSSQKRNVQESERRKREQHGRQHPRRQRRRIGLHENRLWMKRPEHVHAEMNEGDEQRAQNSKYGGITRAHAAIFDCPAKNDVCNEDEPEKKRERQPRIPRPVRSPDRFPPERARNQNDCREHETNLRRRFSDTIESLVAKPQVENTREADDAK